MITEENKRKIKENQGKQRIAKANRSRIKENLGKNWWGIRQNCGVASDQATLNDFQRLFKCKGLNEPLKSDNGNIKSQW